MAELKIETRYEVYEAEQFPVRIGRAVDNDIVIRALGVADYHLIIEESPEGLQIRNLHEAQINSKNLRSRAVIDKNTAITIGSSLIKLWIDPKAPMPNAAKSGKWLWITQPVAAICWFMLALALPMWTDYLETPINYFANWRLLFFSAATILAIVWVIHSMILPLVRRYLLIPLLGLVPPLPLFTTINDKIVYWLIFQLNINWLDFPAFLLSCGVFIWIFRAFFRDFVPLSGRLLTRYTLAICLPCLLLLFYNYLKPHNFFTYRSGSFPSYHKGLLQHKLPLKEEKSISEFFSIEKSN